MTPTTCSASFKLKLLSLLRISSYSPFKAVQGLALDNSRARFRVRNMSSHQAAAQLPRSIRDLVLAASQGTEDFGKSEKDIAEVSEWIAKVADGKIMYPEAAQELDAHLTPKTYLVNNYLSAADVALFGALHASFAQLQPQQYYSHPALTRYFNHIQFRPTVRLAADSMSPNFSLISFDLVNVPKAERKPDPPKKKEKVPAMSTDSKIVAAEPVAELKKDKRERQDTKGKVRQVASSPAEGGSKKKPDAGKASVAPIEDAGEPMPSMIDLRVGHIIDIKKHADADGLYVEQIDFGEETGPRTVVSGLVHYIPIEEMRDKLLVGVCNLKPANMRGVKSFAMVLCATSKDGKEAGIELIQPPAGSKPGDRVYFEGQPFESATPLSQLNPKKKIFETIQPDFTTLDTREAAWVHPATKVVHKIRTEKGVCVAPTLVGASLS